MYKQKREDYYSFEETIDWRNPEFKKVRYYRVGKTTRKNRGHEFILIGIIKNNNDYKLEWADSKQYEDFNTVIYESEN